MLSVSGMGSLLSVGAARAAAAAGVTVETTSTMALDGSPVTPVERLPSMAVRRFNLPREPTGLDTPTPPSIWRNHPMNGSP